MTEYSLASVAQANALYKASAYSGRATPDDCLPGLFSIDGELLAVARLLTTDCNSPCYFLRNLCTAPQVRHQGYGAMLCREIISRTSEPVYLFPLPELVGFYRDAGFIEITPDNLPETLSAHWQAARKHLANTLPMKSVTGDNHT